MLRCSSALISSYSLPLKPQWFCRNHRLGPLRSGRHKPFYQHPDGASPPSWLGRGNLLPQSGYGFVLLHNEYSLAASTLAFPEVKNGMVALLMGRTPVNGKVTLPWLGRGLAAVSAAIVGLAIWNLLRLPRWRAWAVNASRWKLGWSLVWPIAPVLLLLGLPRRHALQSGRYFDHVMLARAMPELMILPGICGALGLVNSVFRYAILARLSPLRARPS